MADYTFEPPLGVTVPGSVTSSLHFLCFSSGSDHSTPELWTDGATSDGSWSAVAFKPVPSAIEGVVWQALVKPQRAGTFGYTYRISRQDAGIQWLGGHGQDGKLVVVPSRGSGESFEDAFDGLESFSLAASAGSNEYSSPSARLYQFAVPRLAPDPVCNYPLPAPLRTGHGLSFERNKPTWYFPQPLASVSDLSERFDSQLVALSRPEADEIVVYYPVSTTETVTVLRGDGKGGVLLRVEREDVESDAVVNAFVVLGKGPASSLVALLEAVISLARSTGVSSAPSDPSTAPAPALASVQALRYCTWNSLGPDYHLSGVLRALDSFAEDKKAGFSHAIDTVLLDDGWQDIGDRPEIGGRGLRTFGAVEGWLDVEGEATRGMQDSGYLSAAASPKLGSDDLERGLEDLRQGVEMIKKSGDGNIKRVGVWLTLAGYWDALDPSGPLASRYDAQRWAVRGAFDSSPTPKPENVWYLPTLDKVDEFWDDYFGALRDAGVDFVKVDNQASIDYIIRCETDAHQSPGAMRLAMHRAMHAATLKHFGNETRAPTGVINCMSHTPRTWGAGPIIPSLVSSADEGPFMRTSDDFFPNEPDSHRWHVWVNLLNTLFLARPLGFSPDLDMLMTDHPFAAYHAALRTFSTSPLYITDEPSKHGGDLVRKCLTAPLKAGGEGVVKTRKEAGAALAGRCLAKRLPIAKEKDAIGGILFAGLAVDTAKGAVLGMWNVKEHGKARDVITARDLKDVLMEDHETRDYVVVTRRQHDAFFLSTRTFEDGDAVMAVELRAGGEGWDTATIAPLYDLPRSGSVDGSAGKIAVVGLVDAICGLSAITSVGVKIRRKRPARTAPIVKQLLPVGEPMSRQSSVASSASDVSTASSTFSSGSFFSESHHRLRGSPHEIWAKVPAAQGGRARFLVSYLAGDRAPASDSAIALRELRNDLAKRPIRTTWSEMRAIVKLMLAVFAVAAGGLWKFVWQSATGGSRRARLQAAPYGRDEKTPLLAPSVSRERGARDPEKAALAGSSVFGAESEQSDFQGEHKVLAVETPFSGRLRFVVIPNKNLNLDEAAVYRSLLVTVDGESLHVPVSFDKPRLSSSGASWYFIDVDLAAVARSCSLPRPEDEEVWRVDVRWTD